MAIMTVLGEINREKLGITLPHEHIFCDLRPLVSPYDDPERQKIFMQKITLQNYGLLTRNPYAILENALLPDEETQIEEVREFKKSGGSTIVDATTEDFGRDPMKLKRVSLATGVNVVAGCGRYVEASVAKADREKSVGELYDEIMTDLCEGIDGTEVRAGCIGEIGTSEKITDFEYRALEAAARAQKDTGVGLGIHACLWNRTGLEALDFAVKNGADPQKTMVCHSDVLMDEGYMYGILERGAYLEFDNLGKEFYVDRKYRNLLQGSFATDRDRVKAMCDFIEKGYANKLLITNDICLRSMTHSCGGWGYDHITENIMPMMEDFGISKEDIETITVKNPAEFLDK